MSTYDISRDRKLFGQSNFGGRRTSLGTCSTPYLCLHPDFVEMLIFFLISLALGRNFQDQLQRILDAFEKMKIILYIIMKN